jgi:hypothetical protein
MVATQPHGMHYIKMIYKYNIIKQMLTYINAKVQEYRYKSKVDEVTIYEKENSNLVKILFAGHSNPIVYESKKK